jgi:hypothetical protein
MADRFFLGKCRLGKRLTRYFFALYIRIVSSSEGLIEF